MRIADENYRYDNCKCRSDFIEKAVRFYAGYLHTKRAADYLPRVLTDVWIGTVSTLCDRIGRLMFKQAVECNITNHIIAADTDMDLDTYERLRNRSVREVKQTRGEISFKDDLIFQKSL